MLSLQRKQAMRRRGYARSVRRRPTAWPADSLRVGRLGAAGRGIPVVVMGQEADAQHDWRFARLVAAIVLAAALLAFFGA